VLIYSFIGGNIVNPYVIGALIAVSVGICGYYVFDILRKNKVKDTDIDIDIDMDTHL
jgi:hypothetical protein